MGCNAYSDPSVPSWPLYVNQGAYYDQKIAWLEPDKTTPISNVGYAAKMQVRQTPQSDFVILELSTENGGLVLGGSNGLTNIIIAEDATQDLPPAEYVYDMKLTPPNDEPFFWLKGIFTVIATTTRP